MPKVFEALRITDKSWRRSPLQDRIKALVDLFEADQGEKSFTEILTKAKKHCIPTGRINKIRPKIPTDTAKLMDRRDHLRQTDPTNPEITTLNNTITNQLNDHKRTQWHKHLEDCEPNTQKLWKTIC